MSLFDLEVWWKGYKEHDSSLVLNLHGC